MIDENMQITYKDIESLIPYENNARTHSKEQVTQIAASIAEFGWTNPILIDEEGGVIAGHGRIEAARDMGIESVPCVTLSGLDIIQKRAYIIADNKLALNAGWNDEMLALELKELQELDFDIDLTGFTLDEFNELLPEQIEPGLTDEDAVPEVPDQPVTKLGDVWLLGKHRVMCGDSTSIDAVEKLMDGKRADTGFCDPPYNLGFRYNSYDDNKTQKEYLDFTRAWFNNLLVITDRQIITLGTSNIDIMAGLHNVAGVACWVKKNWVTGCHIANLQQWEPIFFYGDYTKFKRNSDLFEVNRVVQKDVGDNHTCPKQIILIEDILINYSENICVDLFGGSGTTLIACQKTNRINMSMELDPKYCDVIVNRWQDYTGLSATLESTGEIFSKVSNE